MQRRGKKQKQKHKQSDNQTYCKWGNRLSTRNVSSTQKNHMQYSWSKLNQKSQSVSCRCNCLFKTCLIVWLLVFLTPSNFFLTMSLHSQILAIKLVRTMILLAIGTVAKSTQIRPRLHETRISPWHFGKLARPFIHAKSSLVFVLCLCSSLHNRQLALTNVWTEMCQ